MPYNQPYQVLGFHSCDKSVGVSVLNGNDQLWPSVNSWDWLGSGIYFWEQNPGRALQYAEESAAGKQKNKVQIKTPFVIGAIIELGNCLNLLEPGSIQIVKDAHDALKQIIDESGSEMPENKGPKRELDCAVIQSVHQINKKYGIAPYDSIRCAFPEGRKLYADSNFYDRLHIEICVIKNDIIKGFFLPRPIAEFNPNL